MREGEAKNCCEKPPRRPVGEVLKRLQNAKSRVASKVSTLDVFDDRNYCQYEHLEIPWLGDYLVYSFSFCNLKIIFFIHFNCLLIPICNMEKNWAYSSFLHIRYGKLQ